MSTRGMWSSAIVHFEDHAIAGEHAAKIINLPNDMSSCELYIIVAQMGVKLVIFQEIHMKKKQKNGNCNIRSAERKATIIGQVWEAGDLKIKIVDTTTKTCHQYHAEDHLIFKCPDHIDLGTGYSDAVKRNVNRDKGNKEGDNILDIKQHNNNMEEKVQALEEYVGKENFDEAMEEDEDLDNTVEEVLNATTENIRTKEKQVTQIEQIADTVKMLANLIPELKQSNVEIQKRLERMENRSYLSKKTGNIGSISY
ncbi:3809_t:CDS:2 [Diversispora eburnea]|uniref:3809_t:CDS:1 n=1 Tax=Diversispora eburnea TaxID=1213867 RepID=A0A9N9G4K6_9GLOM|nr:3809_t:CDS:2 [Diversispora eburnea]